MAQAQDINKTWVVPSQELEITEKGTTSGSKITLSTAGKFLDRNIEISAPKATVAEGEVAAAVSATTNGSASNTANGFTASTDATNYYVELSTESGSATAKATVPTAGFVALSDEDTSAPTEIQVVGDGSKLYIPEAGVEAAVGDITVPVVSTSATTDLATSEAATSYYVEVSSSVTKGSVKATAAGTSTGMVSTATTDESAASEIDATVDAAKKVYLKGSTYANSGTAGTDYTDISESAPVLIDGDYLYINAGYSPAAKISLAKLVPDGSNVEGKENLVYKSVSVYDNDGHLVAGTMDDAEISAEASNVSANISSVTPSYNATSGKFDISGEGDITGKINASTTVTGYAVVGTTKAEDIAITGDATLTATLNKVEVSAVKDDDISIIPTVTNKASVVTGKTQIDVVPTTDSANINKYYVAVTVSGNDSATVSPTIAKAGYTDGTNFDANDVTVNAEIGTNVTYVPIAEAVVAADSASATITAGTGIVVSETAPTGDYYTVTANAEGNSKVTSAGYIAAGSLDAASATKDYYIAKSTHTNTITAPESVKVSYNYTTAAPTVSSGDYNISGITTTAPASVPYITIAPSVTEGSTSAAVNASAVNTAGYCEGDTIAATEKSISIASEGTAGNSRYIEIYTGLYEI